MNRSSSSGLPAVDAPTPGPRGSNRHFDTFETQFFKEGEESETRATVVGTERFEDLDDGKRRRFAPSRQFIIGVAAGSVCLAVIGCVVLWRGGSHSNSSAPGVQESAAVSPTVSAPAANPVAVAPVAPPPATAPAAADEPQVVPPAAVPVAAQPQPEPAAPVAVQPKAEPEAPAVLPVKVALAAEAPTAEKPVPAAAPVATGAADARARCKEIASSRRQKDLVSVCSDAFAADPTADVAVILAKAEFDKGRSAQALAWSQKALAADPNAAEAYVFLGGAEQNAGHNKAAKEAYKHYLQLAPSGRYASDLRVIVGSL